MKLLIDMNLSPRWVEFLRGFDFRADHWMTLGNPSAQDSQIMAFAAGHDYVVLTNDLDFSAILAATRGEKPSVVQIRSGNVSPEAIGDNVVFGLRQMRSELEGGALLSLDPNRMRLRLLPLSSGTNSSEGELPS